MQISPDYISYPTSVSNFLFFPRKFILKKLHIQPEAERGPGLLAGVLVHSIAEQLFKNIDPNQASLSPEGHFIDIVKNLRTTKWDYNIPNEKVPIIDEMLQNLAMYTASTYKLLKAQNRLPQFMPFSLEEEIISPTLKIGARIDRINQSKNFIDYKTDALFPEILLRQKSSLTPSELFDYNFSYTHLLIQAVIGAMLIEEKYGVLPSHCSFMYLRYLTITGNGIITVTISQEKKDLVMSYIAKMLSDIQNDIFPACTSKHPRACYFYNSPCEFKTKCDATSLCILSI
jgi:hypothetical protein